MGAGWTHSYSAHITIAGGTPLVLIGANGYAQPLVEEPAASGIYLSVGGSGSQLRASGSEWVLYKASGAREFYGATGKLLRLENATGQVTTLTYDSDDLLSLVTGPFGHTLAIGYDALKANIETVTDPMGLNITYSYDGNRNLEYVTYQDTKQRQYLYEDLDFPNHLTGIMDENLARFSTYAYDNQGRVILSEHAGSIGKMTLVYTATETTVTDNASPPNVQTYSFTPNPNQWTWRHGSNVFDSQQAAVASARAVSPATSNLVPLLSINNYLVTSDQSRKVLDASIGGLGPVYDYDDTDYARRPSTVTDENNVVTKYGYDTYHRTDIYEDYDVASGSSARHTAFRNFLEATSELPQTVETPSVDGTNKRTVSTAYYAGTRVPSSITVTGFDPAGNAVAPRTTSFNNLDAFNRPQQIDGPRAGPIDLTTIAYYATDELDIACNLTSGGRCGQLKSVTNALSHITNFNEYFADGRLKKMTDPNGLATDYTYTSRGWVNTITETAGTTIRTTDYDYDSVGQIDKVTFPNGLILDYQWTDAHLLDYITDNDGSKIDFSYDSRGNRTDEDIKDPGGVIKKSLKQTYDARNRLDTIQEGANLVTDLDFDAAGNLEFETDPKSNPTDYGYDTLNRLSSILDATLIGNTIYGYDIQDNLTSVTAPNNANTSYEYDDLGNLLKEVSPDRGTTLYGYDAAGNMTCKADGRYTAGYTSCAAVPERWVYNYDALNRVDTINYMSTPSIALDVNYDYDGANEKGRLDLVSQEITSGEIVNTQYDYDLFGNLTKQSQFIPSSPAPAGYVTEYEYDGNDQITKMTYPSGRVVDYVRNTVGRIRQISMTSPADPSGTTLVNNVLYKPFGPPATIALGNGLFSVRTYDTAYRVSDSGLVDISSIPIVTLVDYHLYFLDPAANVSNDLDLAGPGNDRDYKYDVLHRLTDDTYVDTNLSIDTYIYDGNGNRSTRTATEPGFNSQTIVYDTGNSKPNLMTTFNGQPVTYDGAGNMLDNGAGSVFTFNPANRLDTITSGGDTLTTLYNGLGELARTKTVPACPNGGCATWDDYFHFASDGRALGLVQQSNSGDIIERDWVWLDGIPIAQIQESYDDTGVHVGTEITYLHTDRLGTPRVGTNAAGIMTWEYTSDAFGQAQIGGSGVTVPLRMPGQIDYGVGGVYYNYYRDYDSNTGRYLESDPIGLLGGLNTYGYVRNNPLIFIDPFGLACKVSFFRRALDNFTRTNEALPGLLAPTGLGLLTAGELGRVTGVPTALQAIRTLKTGEFLAGAARLTRLEALISAGGLSAVNFGLVSAAFESGVAIGSVISAGILPCEQKPEIVSKEKNTCSE